MKEFNTTGICNPDKHYMVDISEKLTKIKALVDAGKYFCINRARQYGKTTTLSALKKVLTSSYSVISLDFQGIGQSGFETEEKFVQEFSRLIWNRRKIDNGLSSELLDQLNEWKNAKNPTVRLGELFDLLSDWCEQSDKGIVLMIDEVDSAANNQVFLDFLAQLRDGFLSRERDGVKTFQSVILAGVTDVKHLKAKIRPEEAHKENSPWNIAADFIIDMSLSENGIKGMLNEYEADHHTGMDIAMMAKGLRKYTSGYPYLVSRLCQLIDSIVREKLGAADAWTQQGLDEAVKLILADGEDTLFGSLMSKLTNLPRLKGQLRNVLMKGDVIPWLPHDPDQSLLRMYGFIKNNHNTVALSNQIFEMLLYPYFLNESQKNDAFRSDALLNKSIFINDDHTLNMPLILEHFIDTQKRVHGETDDKFLEEEGRERFLTYLAPIINGTGTYSIEEQTRDKLRMDVVIHYLGKRYVVELKIWRGSRYNEDGEKQIIEYLDYFGLSTGYMVSFNFNKNKQRKVKRINIGGKVLFEATV